ncbi:MAG: cation transporter [Marmoricola sp.]|nr:cation transporter [Marmoricola sp.]
MNEAFLLAALRRSARPADADHPFGYGMERYFWSLLAAVAIFVLGAGFSIYQGVTAIVAPRAEGHLAVALVVLVVAFVFDGASLVRAGWQLRREAREKDTPFLMHVLYGAEPAVRAVAVEDLVAVIGVVLAATGLVLDRLLGTTLYDAAASIAIGLLLIGTAYLLGRQNEQLLIGRAVGTEVLTAIDDEISASDGIERWPSSSRCSSVPGRCSWPPGSRWRRTCPGATWRCSPTRSMPGSSRGSPRSGTSSWIRRRRRTHDSPSAG